MSVSIVPQGTPTSAVAPQNRQLNVSETAKAPEAAGAEVNVDKPTSQDDAKLSQRFAQIARKERAIQAEAQRIRAERDAIKREQEAMKSSYLSKSELLEKAQRNPVEFIREMGISYDHLTNAILNGPSPQDEVINELKAKLQKLEEGQSKALTTIEEQQKRSYEQAVKQITGEVKGLVQSDANFETIREMGAEEAVVELIQETFNSTGELMSIEQACKDVEDYLVAQAEKIASLPKIKTKFMPPPPVEPEQKPQGQTMKTLTHSIGASTQPLTDKQRRERAIAAFKGELK